MNNLLISPVTVRYFLGTDPKIEQLGGTLIMIMIFTVLACFLISEITRNYSQVDKLWSLMPVVYCIVTLIQFPTPRIIIMTSLVGLWGFRLSYNFSRKGGYNIIPWKGEEDYRWTIMRQRPALNGRFRFGLFNLFFISFYQNFLILLFTTPVMIAAICSDKGLNTIDIISAVLMLIFLIIETIADNQLFRFHQMKKKKIEPEDHYTLSLKNGFMSDGLWRYVRHPNFAAEQAIWISFYFFSVAASGKWINWTLSGAVLLMLLFVGSSELTERISKSKYDGYENYKKEVPRFMPWRFNVKRK